MSIRVDVSPPATYVSALIPRDPTHPTTQPPQAERDKKLEEERKQELQRKIKEAQRREKQKEEDAKRKEQISRVRMTPPYVFSGTPGGSFFALPNTLEFSPRRFVGSSASRQFFPSGVEALVCFSCRKFCFPAEFAGA